MLKIVPPSAESLSSYYISYWKYLKTNDLLAGIAEQDEIITHLLSTVSSEKENYAYASGKWMLKEVVGHLSDTERILAFRALSFSRNDKTHLPSFDENSYIVESNFRERTLKEIVSEWKTVRAATISLFSSMTEPLLDRKGTANNTTLTPRILLYFILVHAKHHMNVIREKYLGLAVD